jgi:fused signal recognition particle receptor
VNDNSDDNTKPARPRRWFGLFEPATTPSTVTPTPTPPPMAPKKGWFGRVAPSATPQSEPAPLAPEPAVAPEQPEIAVIAEDVWAPPEPTIAFAPEPDEAPEPPALAEELAETAPTAPKKSWFKRLTEGLARSSSAIGRGIVDIFAKRKLDAASLDDLEDILIQADLGIGAATRIREAIGKGRYEKGIDPEEVKTLLAAEVERTLTPVARPLVIDETIKPFVILVVGVNGSGKTTTIGKLAAKFASEGRRVTLAAGDTFRAAAIAQLKIWADRVGADFIAREQGGDAAGLAFDAVTRAKASGADVLLMDTAGRLQNRAELMSELEKIIRVMKKVDPAAPHATLLVLDATVGQNALSQVEIFGRMAGVTGLVMTKLDGTARGGILVAIADKFKTPVHFIGVGETVDDLEPFAPRDFARAIAGLEEE